MTALERTFKSILTILIVIAGATFFYLSGVGTGLHVARTTFAAQSGSLVPSPSTSVPVYITEVPTSTSIPAPTPTVTPLPQAPRGEGDFFGVFWEAWDILEQEFYGQLPAESELPYAAVRGVIAATGDQYTAFLDPIQAEILQTDLSGSFEGIGATVRLRPDGRLEVVQPLPGWPAIQAGLRAKDVIVEVDGVEIQGKSLYEAISLIRGPAGTIVRLLVERENVDLPLEIEIERAHIELPVVENKMLEDDIAYVRLSDFGETATDRLKEALRMLDVEDRRGLILDLRGNRGGYLSVAVEVTSQFVAEGPILVERFKDGREQRYPAMSGGLALDVPLVVLVDGGSASASEIAAGAIQDTGRGVLIGTTTLGKGSVQMVHTLSDGSQLRVTTARWFTPNGRAIHDQGLEPDIEVAVAEEDILADRDPQLERAIAYLLEDE